MISSFFAVLTQIRNDKRDAVAEMKVRHEREMKVAVQEAFGAADRLRQLVVIADPLRMDRGNDVLFIAGRECMVGDWERVIDAAVADLLRGVPTMQHSYFATKNYDRWSGQFIGAVPYGRGPSHGSVVFSIGLHGAYQLSTIGTKQLTDDNVGDALYVLERLRAEAQEAALRRRSA